MNDRNIHIALYLVGVLSVILALASVASATKPAGLKVGELAPSFTMKTLNPSLSLTKVLSLKNVVGPSSETTKKAVLLTFSASYCAPCKKELAYLKQLAPRLEEAGVLVTAVVIDKEESGIEEMRKLVTEELKLSFPVLLDRFGILARRYSAESLPFMVVIDSSGKITGIHTGYDQAVLDGLMKDLGVSDKAR